MTIGGLDVFISESSEYGFKKPIRMVRDKLKGDDFGFIVRQEIHKQNIEGYLSSNELIAKMTIFVIGILK